MLPISEKSLDFARKIANELSSAGIRVTLNAGEEKIGAKIRDAEMAKIPYMLVVGEKEAAANSVSVRRHGKGDMGVNLARVKRWEDLIATASANETP